MPAGAIYKGTSSPLFRPRPPANRIRLARIGLIAFFIILTGYFLLHSYPAGSSISGDNADYDLSRVLSSSPRKGVVPRITKVSMLFGEETNPLYVRALMTHGEHNRRWNYGMEILQQDVAQGYWNKPSYLISLLVRELAKPPGHRVEWLMWVDADLILLNPSVPLETFLPPENGPQIHFLGNRDHKGLNTGTFFLRVHPWSIRMLEKATALPMYLPDIDLDTSVDQTAMSIVMSEAEFSQNHEVLFQPRVWYNSYQFHHAFEGKDGDLLVHFPGLEEERWDFMAKWLDEVEKTTGKHDLAIDNTRYPSETKKFWTLVDDARNLLTKAHQQMDAAQTGSGMQGVMHAREELLSVIIGTKYPVPPGSDDFELYEKKIKELKDAMGE